jgi:WD40 repeat protein
LIATGGHSSVVTVWNADTTKDYAKLDHCALDPDLKGIEIDWQDHKRLAITGKSKQIYFWNVD